MRGSGTTCGVTRPVTASSTPAAGHRIRTPPVTGLMSISDAVPLGLGPRSVSMPEMRVSARSCVGSALDTARSLAAHREADGAAHGGLGTPAWRLSTHAARNDSTATDTSYGVLGRTRCRWAPVETRGREMAPQPGRPQHSGRAQE